MPAGLSRWPRIFRIPTNDHWIAAIALRNNHTLLTRDRHFEKIAGLALRHWEE